MATVFTDQITGSGETVAYKAPCRVATTANIALSGLLTVDSVVLVADDRVLVKNQTAPSENGIWIANSGAWQRARDFDSKRDIANGTRVTVTDGTANGGRDYRVIGVNPIIVGTDAITISETLSSDSGSNAAAAQAAADAAQAVLADPNFVAVAGIADEIATVAGLAPDIPGIPANVTAAQLAETNAQKWATNPEDVEVTPGLFSAFHWYRKSLAIWTNLTNTVAGWIHGSGTKTTLVDADEFGIADSEWSWALSKVSWASIKAGIASAAMTLTNKTLTSPTVTTPTLTLKQSAAAAPTASGDIQLDTTTEALVIGDGAAPSVFPRLPASVAAGDIFYATAARTLARLAKGTGLQSLIMNPGATAPQWATPTFAKPMYESGLSVITAGGTLTLAHGLGDIPTFIFPYFICVTASQGYAVGDIIPMNPARFVIVPDATNLNIRFENTTASYGYYSKTTGAFGNLVAASWNFGVRAGL
ncbi:hypothetical protein WHT83_06205 [Aminobacter sp. P9b]|uniref:hypothetical protein n=1 Tax=Aminobacter sp. P9b TaxID=3133697 RepID=UPI00324F6DB2